MHILLVAGARPNFMKVAPVLRSAERAGHRVRLVHTGQHYDDRMSDSFFRDLAIRVPDHHLGVGSASHAVQTARVMEAFEPVLLQTRPDWVLVPGDVNSTLACALVTVKLKEETGARLAHLEAGLRSRDWRMPEEVNRVLTDRCSDLLLTTTPDAAANLAAEGIDADRVAFVGNVMIDTLLHHLDDARALRMAASLGLGARPWVLATLHRPSNVDDRDALDTCLAAFADLAANAGVDVVLPLHPRTRHRVDGFGLHDRLRGVRVTEPLAYREMLGLMDGAAAVLTDSGGVQEETTALGVPCVTLREQTERPVTVEQGTNRLAPWPLTREGIVNAARAAIATGRAAPGTRSPDGWDGRAADRVVTALERALTGTP
jgi:UDP-N-acetylglucosamine 2-epimerase (non-hydrolysing)